MNKFLVLAGPYSQCAEKVNLGRTIAYNPSSSSAIIGAPPVPAIHSQTVANTGSFRELRTLGQCFARAFGILHGHKRELYKATSLVQ